MKNELIIAEKKGKSSKRAAGRLSEMLEMLGLEALQERFFLPDQLQESISK